MSSTAATSLKRSRSSTPLLSTPRTQSPLTEKDSPSRLELTTGEPQIKQELERWENIVFSFGMEGHKDGHSNQEGYPGRYPHHTTTHAHGHSEPIHPTSGDLPGFPIAPWNTPPFFPAPPYGQQLPYDMFGLGAMNIVSPTQQHSGSHVAPSPFETPWDPSLVGEMPPQAHLPPLTPAEIAQYHSLVARGAANFPTTSLNVSPPITTPESPSPSSPSPPASQAASTRSRSTSNAGRNPSQGQSSGAAIVDDETTVLAEDKRRRNTAASARFRIKKKQRTMELERSVIELEGRADELEKEAVELRRENGWLKEMVILKGRKAMENAQAAGNFNAEAGPSVAGDRNRPTIGPNDTEVGSNTDKGRGKPKE